MFDLLNINEPEIELTDYSELDESVKVQVITGIELVSSLPAGGKKHQLLSKRSDVDYDVEWINKLEINIENGEGADSIKQKYSGIIDSTHFGNTNTGKSSAVFGEANNNEGTRNIVGGKMGNIKGSNSIVAGLGNGRGIASTPELEPIEGNNNIIAGLKNQNKGSNNVLVGNENKNNNDDSIIGGGRNTNNQIRNIMTGYGNTCNGADSIICGYGTTNSTQGGITGGIGTRNFTNNGIVAGRYNTDRGRLNEPLLFALGNGSDADHRSNAFEVTDDGRVRGSGTPIGPTDFVRMLELDNVKQTIETLHKNGFVVVETLPTASKDTIGKIYLVLQENSSITNIYDEYITIETSTNVYSWEKIGSTQFTLIVDSELSIDSENPVQNKVIAEALDGKVNVLTSNPGGLYVYGQNANKQETQFLIANAAASMTQGRIAMYFAEASSQGASEPSGKLICGTPTKDYHVANKLYVDTVAEDKLDKDIIPSAKNNLRQVLVINTAEDGGGVSARDMANYVVNNALVQRTSTGQIPVPLTPEVDNNATSKQYVDTVASDINDTLDTKVSKITTPSTGYVRVYAHNTNGDDIAMNVDDGLAGVWRLAQYMSNTSGNSKPSNGRLIQRNPELPYQVANKLYVDTIATEINDTLKENKTDIDQLYLYLNATVTGTEELTQEYSERQTADGLSGLIDGALTRVTKVQGNTVKNKNLFNTRTRTSGYNSVVEILSESSIEITANKDDTSYVEYAIKVKIGQEYTVAARTDKLTGNGNYPRVILARGSNAKEIIGTVNVVKTNWGRTTFTADVETVYFLL
jgi:hypothetical protein